MDGIMCQGAPKCRIVSHLNQNYWWDLMVSGLPRGPAAPSVGNLQDVMYLEVAEFLASRHGELYNNHRGQNGYSSLVDFNLKLIRENTMSHILLGSWFRQTQRVHAVQCRW